MFTILTSASLRVPRQTSTVLGRFPSLDSEGDSVGDDVLDDVGRSDDAAGGERRQDNRNLPITLQQDDRIVNSRLACGTRMAERQPFSKCNFASKRSFWRNGSLDVTV